MGNILLAPCLPIMHCLGFTVVGIARGSCAALTQSCIGIVHVGSWFAQCQSAAARSSPCGCICVLLCWVGIFLSFGFWIFGLPIWVEDLEWEAKNVTENAYSKIHDWVENLWEGNMTKNVSSTVHDLVEDLQVRNVTENAYSKLHDWVEDQQVRNVTENAYSKLHDWVEDQQVRNVTENVRSTLLGWLGNLWE